MNATNMNQPGTRSFSQAGIWSGIFLFIIGCLIGVFGSRAYWEKPATVALDSRAQTVATPALAAQSAVNTSASLQLDQWDPLRAMSRMQAQIDKIFHQSFAQFRNSPGLNAMAAKPGESSSIDVRDLKDKYQVLAFLPDTKPADVKVSLKGDELKVDMDKKITEKPTVKNGETAVTEWGNYEEVVRLAGPLKANQMTVQRQPHELVISVPKA